MDVIQAIQSVGFPIVAFLIAVYGIKYAYDKSLDQQNKSLDSITELSKAVNHNTEVLTQLVEEIKDLEYINIDEKKGEK